LRDDARSTEILEKRFVRFGFLTKVFGKDVVRHLKDERQPCQKPAFYRPAQAQVGLQFGERDGLILGEFRSHLLQFVEGRLEKCTMESHSRSLFSIACKACFSEKHAYGGFPSPSLSMRPFIDADAGTYDLLPKPERCLGKLDEVQAIGSEQFGEFRIKRRKAKAGSRENRQVYVLRMLWGVDCGAKKVSQADWIPRAKHGKPLLPAWSQSSQRRQMSVLLAHSHSQSPPALSHELAQQGSAPGRPCEEQSREQILCTPGVPKQPL
jgi:hypothetical protein